MIELIIKLFINLIISRTERRKTMMLAGAVFGAHLVFAGGMFILGRS